MNLSGEMQLPTRYPHDAFSTGRSPRAVPMTFTRAPLGPTSQRSPSLAMRRSPAMPPTPSTTSSTTVSSRSFPSNPLATIKSEPADFHELSLPDSSFSPRSVPSVSPVPRGSGPERAFAERSPSPHAHNPPATGAMADALSSAKNPGLIRRLSRGAQNKLRRRASTTHSMRMRDQSAGPVLMRRRSDSNGASDFGQDVSDLDLDSTNDEVIEELPLHHHAAARDHPSGLGISMPRPKLAPSSTASSIFEGGIAPATSVVLENGTWLDKITKRRMKRIKLWLDSSTARVCWHSSNPYKSFFIDDVRELRVGVESRNARDDAQVSDENEARWVTIVYDVPDRSKGRNIKTMHVLMPDDYLLKLWTDALNTVSRQRVEVMNALASSPEKNERSMAMAWRQAMTRKGPAAEQRFTLDDARWLCRQLEINCTDSAVRTHFKLISNDETASLDYEQYRSFVQTFRERKDLRQILRNVKLGTESDMDLESFLHFLHTEQKVDVAKERSYWEGIFDKFARYPAPSRTSQPNAEGASERRMLTTQGFQNFMTSSHTEPLIRSKGEPNLDRPLNEYFISSSHNTYLLGRQVAGASSVEGYIAALVKGCRCIEIDCWDGDDGRPMVTHGRTMTTKVPFEDCVSVVAKYAFNSSPYPLIVSLEVHCGPEQQLVMVDLMKKYFGTALLTEPIDQNSISLPSPEELKYKILIKVKASEDIDQPPPVADAPGGRSRARSIGSAFTRTSTATDVISSSVSSPMLGSVAGSPPNSHHPWTTRSSATCVPSATPSSSADDSDDIPAVVDRTKKRKTSRIVHDLGILGVYTQGIKFNGFQSPDAKTYNHVYSFAENTFDRLSVKNTDEKAMLEMHNTHHLMRVYPGARRIDSSNFNPLAPWRRGVQMAALNWQTYDVHQQVNEAMFAAGTDRLGYVLKPEELRHSKHQPISETVVDLLERKEKKDRKLVKFSMEVVSAQRLPRPRHQSSESGMNPYIEFEMFSAEDRARGNAMSAGGTDASARDGSSGIGSPLRKRTKIVEGNGFDPMYHQSISMAVETKYPSLIFVRWTVWNSPDRKTASNSVLLATFTAKLDSLQQGYRHLPLFNPQGEQYRDAKLFVKIRKEDAVALSRSSVKPSKIQEPSASPRPEAARAERSWPRRIFSRQPSERRKREPNSNDIFAGSISRTSSVDRESAQ